MVLFHDVCRMRYPTKVKHSREQEHSLSTLKSLSFHISKIIYNVTIATSVNETKKLKLLPVNPTRVACETM